MLEDEGISKRTAVVLMILCALAAIGLFVLLLVPSRGTDPMHPKDEFEMEESQRRTPRDEQVPAQQRLNPDAMPRKAGSKY